MERFPVQKKGSHECSNSRKESNDFLFIVPRRYISTAATFSSSFSVLLFFPPLPSLSRKRDKHERAGIDLSEALHEHQQRSRNKSKRVEDPPKRARPLPNIDSFLPPRSYLAEPFCLFWSLTFFLKNRRCMWGALSRPCPRVILPTFRHTRYTPPPLFLYPSLLDSLSFLRSLSFSFLRTIILFDINRRNWRILLSFSTHPWTTNSIISWKVTIILFDIDPRNWRILLSSTMPPWTTWIISPENCCVQPRYLVAVGLRVKRETNGGIPLWDAFASGTSLLLRELPM